MSVKDHAMPTRLSAQGARFIGHFEGFRPHLYNDAAGHCTIGYGHLVHMGACNGTEPQEFKRGLTQGEAESLLQEDAQKAADAVRSDVHVPLNQQQFDALVSFVYNLGAAAFASSTLLRDLNARNFGAAPGQLRQWTHAGGKVLPGLVARRNAEAELFSSGRYAF
jgi:GH24 family phage-related lysozyme (muramidase)